MTRLWRDHSLTIILGAAGVALLLWAFQHEPGNWFDLWMTLGGGLLTVALFYAAAGFLRERNKPET
jgi:polyferredoxin